MAASFSLFFLFNSANGKYVSYIFLPMTGFKPQISGIGSNFFAI